MATFAAAATVRNWKFQLIRVSSIWCLDTKWTVIRAPGLVLYPYVFVAGPNKHDILSGILVRTETSSQTRPRWLLVNQPKSSTS